MAETEGIKRNEIIEDKVFSIGKDLAPEFDKIAKSLDNVARVAEQLNTTLAKADGLGKVRTEGEKLTATQKELEKAQKALQTAQARNNEEYANSQRLLKAERDALKEKIALEGQDAKTITALNSSREKLGVALATNIRAYSQLTSEEQRNSVEGQALLGIITKQREGYESLSAKLGDNRAKVGSYTSGIIEAWVQIKNLEKENAALAASQQKVAETTGKDSQAFKQLSNEVAANNGKIDQLNKTISTTKQSFKDWTSSILGSFGIIAGIYGVIQAITAFISVNRDLEKSLSTLKALTGASTEDLTFYKQAAIDIGVETKRSAKDVVEAFKLIGGARPELLANKEALAATTKEAIVLANASGLTLKDAADALGGALNQLELDATQSSRAINAYAAGAKEGAAEIPDINAAYKEFGAVLRGNNGSLEEGVALIEVLASRQIKGAEAGTALRNVLLSLSAVNVLPRSAREQMTKFGVDLKIVGDNSLPLNQRLRELGKISGDASAMVKVFGKENFVAGNIVLNNIDSFEKLTEKVTGTDEAYRQASASIDNFQGDLDEAGSVTSALAVEIGESTQGILRGVVQFYITIVNTLRALPGFLKDNKELIIALTLSILALNKQLVISNYNLLKNAASLALLEIREKAALITTRAFYTTLAANPFGVILVSVTALIAALTLYDKTSERANTISQRSSEITKELDEDLKAIVEIRENLNISIDEYSKLSRKEQAEMQVEAIYRKQQAQQILGVTLARIEDLKEVASELTAMQKLKIGLTSLAGSYGVLSAAISSTEFSGQNVSDAVSQFDEKIKGLKEEIAKYDDFIKDSGKANKDEAVKQGKAERDSAYQLQRFRLEQAIKAQETIRDTESKAFDERYAAEANAADKRIQLADLERRHTLEKDKITNSERILAQEKFEAERNDIIIKSNEKKISLKQGDIEEDRQTQEALLNSIVKSNDNILNYEFASEEQRKQALIDNYAAKQELLQIDYERQQEKAKGNYKELERLQLEFNNNSEALTKEFKEGVENNTIEAVKKGYQQLLNIGHDTQAQRKAELDKEYTDGLISTTEYQGKRVQIEIDTNKQLMQLSIDYLKERLEHFTGSEKDRLSIQKEIANAEIALAEYTAEKKLEAEQKFHAAAMNLEQVAFSSAATIANNLAATENQKVDAKLAALKRETEGQLKLAGDNQAAKDIIQANADAKERKLQDEKRRNQRKAAQFQKALAISQIIVDTARAIMSAYAEYPYPVALGISALVGAAGALEIATAASAPVPSYEIGTRDHKGGLARVHSGEIVEEPSGRTILTNKDSLMNLEKHSKVYTKRETTRMLAYAALGKTDYSPIIGNAGSNKLEEAVNKFAGIVNKQSGNHIRLFTQFGKVYAASKAADEELIRIKRVSFGYHG